VTISVVVADDEAMIRAGIVMLLNAQPDIEVIGEASTGQEALDLARSHRPDVIVMDLRMPVLDGASATAILSQDETSLSDDRLTKVLILTTFNEDEAVHSALRAGASGFLLKYAAPRDLVDAVRSIANGGGWIDRRVAGKVIDALAKVPRQGERGKELLASLTRRESEILKLMAAGMANQEIKNQLFLSEATVKTHVARILMKTGSRDRTQAVVLAFRSGLIPP
jgi:DNA-binding NarL/FixJ family response regulator